MISLALLAVISSPASSAPAPTSATATEPAAAPAEDPPRAPFGPRATPLADPYSDGTSSAGSGTAGAQGTSPAASGSQSLENPFDRPAAAPPTIVHDPPATTTTAGAPAPAPAPAPDRPIDDAVKTVDVPRWGGFGHFSPGVLIGDWGDFASSFEHPVMSSTRELKASPVAATVGGGGRALLAGRYLLGGRGFGMWVPTMWTDWGSARVSGGGGGFDLGLVVYNQRRWMVYPFAGVGGLGYTLEVRNNSDAPVTFGGSPLATTPAAGAVIEGGGASKFSTGFWTFELGVGFQRLQYRRKQGGGLINGGELGLLISLHDNAWSDENDVPVIGAPPARMLGVYLRLNIGGGGFFWRSMPAD